MANTYQPLDAGLNSLAGLTYAAASFVKMTGANAFALRTIGQTADDLEGTIDHDNLANTHGAIQPLDTGLTSLAGLTYVSDSFIKVTATDVYAIRTIAETKTDLSLNLVENTALSSWAGTASITTLGTIVTGTWQGTTVAINQGGTGQTTAQAAIDSLSAVSGATNEHVLTKDTATGNAKWKVATGSGGMDYVDRGDPSAWDFDVTDFTADNTWRTFDLSSIVPSGAIAVHLMIYLRDDVANSEFLFRKNGNSNPHNAGRINTQVADIDIRQDIIVTCDANRVLQYKAQTGGGSAGFTYVFVIIRGWWI